MTNYYDKIAMGYEELHREEQEKKIQIIKEHFNVKPKNKLLDVGCGTGLSTIPWNCEVYGLDPSKKLLEKAEKKLHQNSNWVNASAENIPFNDNFFDIVISITAIQNFDNLNKGLDEIKRVGKPNAKFVLTFLKASLRRDIIEKTIESKFNVKEKIEEEKDIIYLV